MATIARGPSVGFVVSYGGEDFFLDRDIESARRWPNRQVVRLDEGIDEATLVSILESRDLDGQPRTVILDEANKLKEGKHKLLRAYVENVSVTDTSTVLVAIVRSEKLTDLWSFIGSKGKLSERKKFKTWQDRKTGKNDYTTWIDSEAKRVGLALDEGVLELLYQMTGQDLYRITNELRKLYMLVGNGNKVTRQHVQLVISPSPNVEPWDVVEHIMSKNLKAAMNSLSVLYKNSGDEALVPLTYGLMRETQKLITARYMLDKGASEEEIAAALGMHPYKYKISFLPNVRKHDVKSLAKHMRRLCKLDQDVKGAARSKRTLLELTVLSLAV